MKTGVEIHLSPEERKRLEAVIGSGNSPQKHVWRARIVLLSADGVGTMAIQRQTGKGKPTIWRWQARFMAEGVDGLLHEATRPGRQAAAAAGSDRAGGRDDARRTAGRGDALDRPGDGQGGRGQPSQRAADLGGARPQAASGPDLQAVERSEVRRQGAGRRRPLCRSAGARAGAVGRREVADPGARPHPAGTADEEGPLRDDDARLQAPRHDDPVRRARRAGRAGHRPVHEPATGIRSSSASSTRSTARPRPSSTCI